jgi:hypothetical protein
MRFPAENLNLEARRINSDSKSQQIAGLQQSRAELLSETNQTGEE